MRGSKKPWTDPGGEIANAPIGSVDWAKRWRLEVQAIVKDIPKEPERFERYYKTGAEYRVWTLLNRRDGSHYSDFKEFCADEYPWGLGTPYEQIEPFLVALHGRRAFGMMTVAPAQSPTAGPGRGHVGKKTEDAERPVFSSTKDKALRAILRAPVEVQDLYREGLISQKVAAALGPKNPAKAPSREAVARTIKSVPRERKAVDMAVRQMLGRESDRVEELVKAVLRLNLEDRKRFDRLLSSGSEPVKLKVARR